MLVVSCGGEDLRNFLKRTVRNDVYTSHVAVVEFMDALGTWVEFLLKRFAQLLPSFFSLQVITTCFVCALTLLFAAVSLCTDLTLSPLNTP